MAVFDLSRTQTWVKIAAAIVVIVIVIMLIGFLGREKFSDVDFVYPLRAPSLSHPPEAQGNHYNRIKNSNVKQQQIDSLLEVQNQYSR